MSSRSRTKDKRARQRRRVYARRRVAALLILSAAVVAVVVALLQDTGQKKIDRPPRPTQAQKTPGKVPPPAAKARLLPWRLPGPRSREVVLPRGRSHSLVVLGGLDSSSTSTDAVDLLDTRDGVFTPLRSLVQATHDAAGAAVGGRILVIGGGTAAPAGATQIESAGASVVAGAPAQARADANAVTIGRVVYVAGGYDGSAMDAEVVATTDGRSYRPIVRLPIPVRYPALAVLGSRIYVFGGLGANGRPSGAVQVVQTDAGTARVVGRLPTPLAGASAGALDGTIYLAGGRTASRPTAAIYAFEPREARFRRAGKLPVAVANAGTTVSDGRLWLVGGETGDGRPTADVQTVVPD